MWKWGPVFGISVRAGQVLGVIAPSDFIPIPKLRVQAMENWGIITMQMGHAIKDSETKSPSEQFTSMKIVLHEISHMWFGNLATMKWWNDLWLNEGFAEFLAHKAAENISGYQEENPSRMCHSLRNDETGRFPSVSRKDFPLFDPMDQFESAYTKPMFLLLMVEKIVGEVAFQNGVGRYLERFQYANADHADLMECLTYAHDSSSGSHLSGQSFSLNEFLSTWIYQKGFPILHVQNRAVGEQIIGQEGCWPLQAQNWKIPLFHRHPVTKQEQLKWLAENEEVSVDLEDDIIVDRDVVGFLRVRYDNTLYDRIVDKLHINKDYFPVPARARLLDDAFTFAEKGIVSYGVTFNMTAYLRHETEFAPVSILHAHLDFIYGRLNDHPEFYKAKAFVSAALSPLFDSFVNTPMQPDSNYLESNLRKIVYFRVCITGYRRCKEHSFEIVDELMETCLYRPLSQCSKIPSYIRSTIYATAVMFGPSRYFDFFLEKLAIEHSLHEKRHIWLALSATNKERDTYRFVEVALNKTTDDRSEEEGFLNRAIDYSKFNHVESYFPLLYVHERRKELARRLSQSKLLALLQWIARCELKIEHDDMYKEVREEFLKASPSLKKYPNYFSRIPPMRVWRSQMADYVIGNISLALDGMENSLEDFN